jgi:hypothetical protein
MKNASITERLAKLSDSGTRLAQKALRPVAPFLPHLVLTLVAIGAGSLVVASCIFPPPIDTSSGGGAVGPAVIDESPPEPGPVVMQIGVPTPFVLDVEDPDVGSTLDVAIYLDYDPTGNAVPPVDVAKFPPPANETDPSAVVRSLMFGSENPYCQTRPPFLVGMGPHQLTAVIFTDGQLDTFQPDKCSTPYMCPAGMTTPNITKVIWNAECVPATGDL